MDFIKEVFGTWYMIAGLIALVVLIIVFFYLRSQRDEDDE